MFDEIKNPGASSPVAPHSLLINDSRLFAMDSLFNAICVLVTAALVLTFVPGLMLRRFPLSMGDRGRALLVCVALGLVAETSVCIGTGSTNGSWRSARPAYWRDIW